MSLKKSWLIWDGASGSPSSEISYHSLHPSLTLHTFPSTPFFLSSVFHPLRTITQSAILKEELLPFPFTAYFNVLVPWQTNFTHCLLQSKRSSLVTPRSFFRHVQRDLSLHEISHANLAHFQSTLSFIDFEFSESLLLLGHSSQQHLPIRD